MPWRIHMVNPPDLTFRGFYHQKGERFIEGGSRWNCIQNRMRAGGHDHYGIIYKSESKDQLDVRLIDPWTLTYK